MDCLKLAAMGPPSYQHLYGNTVCITTHTMPKDKNGGFAMSLHHKPKGDLAVIWKGKTMFTGTGTKHTCDSIIAFCQTSNTWLVCFNSLLQPIALRCPVRAFTAPAIASAFRGGAVWRRWYGRRGRLETAVWALAVTWGWARCRARRADVSYHTP